MSIQHKSSIRKTVAARPTTSIRANLWVVRMLPLAFSVPLVSLPLCLPPRCLGAVAMGRMVSAFPVGSADGYASPVSVPVGVCVHVLHVCGCLCRGER